MGKYTSSSKFSKKRSSSLNRLSLPNFISISVSLAPLFPICQFTIYKHQKILTQKINLKNYQQNYCRNITWLLISSYSSSSLSNKRNPLCFTSLIKRSLIYFSLIRIKDNSIIQSKKIMKLTLVPLWSYPSLNITVSYFI